MKLIDLLQIIDSNTIISISPCSDPSYLLRYVYVSQYKKIYHEVKDTIKDLTVVNLYSKCVLDIARCETISVLYIVCNNNLEV